MTLSREPIFVIRLRNCIGWGKKTVGSCRNGGIYKCVGWSSSQIGDYDGDVDGACVAADSL